MVLVSHCGGILIKEPNPIPSGNVGDLGSYKGCFLGFLLV